MQSPIRIGICRPSRSDNGPTINCPTAKIARKIVMVEVTAALDTRRSAAIVGNEGRKMFVDRTPVAANAQITARQIFAVRCPGFVAGALLRTTSMLMAGVSRTCWSKRRSIGRLNASGRTPAILNNCLWGVVLGTSEAALDRQRLMLPLRCAMRDAGRAATRIKGLRRVTIPVALSQPAASHIPQRA